MSDYTTLITSEHASKPKFVALVSLLTQAIDSNTQLVNSFQTLFDVDTAVGQQLDYTGQWIGITRNVYPSISSAFFSLDTANLGLDQGYWQGILDVGGFTVLPDEAYRQILYAKIAINTWDGTTNSALKILQNALPGVYVSILDNQNMSITISISGTLDALQKQLIEQGYFTARPAGVAVTYDIGSVFFAWNENTATQKGWNTGAFWA